MEFSTFAESWMFLLPFSSLFFKLWVVRVMSQSSGEIDAFVDSDSILQDSFTSSFSLEADELFSSLKNLRISAFNSSKCSSWPSKSMVNSFKKYLTRMSLLSPRQSGSKAYLTPILVKCSANCTICSSSPSSSSSLTVTIHPSSLNGAYSQYSCTSPLPSRIFSKLIRDSFLAALMKWIIVAIISLSSWFQYLRVFLTRARVVQSITSPSSPKGQVFSMTTMNSLGMGIKQIWFKWENFRFQMTLQEGYYKLEGLMSLPTKRMADNMLLWWQELRICDDKWVDCQQLDQLSRDISVLCCLERIYSTTKIKIFL